MTYEAEVVHEAKESRVPRTLQVVGLDRRGPSEVIRGASHAILAPALAIHGMTGRARAPPFCMFDRGLQSLRVGRHLVPSHWPSE